MHINSLLCRSNITTYGIKSVVDDMFKVFTHPDLPHELILVTIHSSQLTNVSKDVLDSIRQLHRRYWIETWITDLQYTTFKTK